MDLHGPETRTQAMSSDCDDDYIDMEVNLSSSSSSSSRFISFAVNSSPPHSSREFEFQMCSSAVASGESATSPADELFYKGQLLPLHLPPRLQMVQKLLASSSSSSAAAISTPSPHAPPLPRRGDSISTELKRFIESKKIKQSSIRQKLKASRAYIRSLFSRPGCSDSSEIHPKFKSETLKNSKKKNPSESLSSKNPPLIHRRSFGSNGSLDLQTLMRSSNASSAEIDNSIEGAIEHCKQSFTTRKSNAGESELSSSRTSVSTCGDVEKG
ncbi:hypothetical protein Bca52824_009285 [Brassica carinata]|uniref:Membrane-associated kinase regulator 3 n=1 Tax=Brassica carinata TaxID=52824 RepID=A0A8X8B9L8_BRACI|nr:hypothetical protein Bca52824_009285 [Brassica carinata]